MAPTIAITDPAPSRARRLAARLAGAALAAVVLVGATGPAASAASLPPHTLEFVSCGGGGNYGATWDYLEPRDPIIYAQNLKPGVAETQRVAWRVRLNRWTGTTWIVDPDLGNWSAWSYKNVVDLDSPYRYVGGAYSVPSGVHLQVPRLGTYYAASVQVAWQNPTTGAWTYGPVEWPGAHLNLVNGSVWIPDVNLGYFGCRYIKDEGSVPLPSPHL